MKPLKSKRLCVGCRNNFYNGNNPAGVRECWSFKKAKVVRRWKLGWWTMPLSPRAFRECWALSCHHAPGQYALMEKPHPEAVNPVRLGKRRGGVHGV